MTLDALNRLLDSLERLSFERGLVSECGGPDHEACRLRRHELANEIPAARQAIIDAFEKAAQLIQPGQ